ncbi:MAG TPA: SRPBCC family protein [Burkholderiales bacterium]|nr:SRPBCC family protein [Burkholderiales bacterium]
MRSPVPYALFFGPVYCLLAWPAGGAETQVSVSKEATVFSVEAVSRVSASQRVAWETLTDYARYPRFVPNLGLSRLASRNPLRVQQKGDFGILFFRKEIYATFDVAERPPSSIRFHAVEGNLKSLDTEVSLEERAGATSIRYHSTIEPDFWVPPLISSTIIRISIREKLQAVAEEIERRAAAAMSR